MFFQKNHEPLVKFPDLEHVAETHINFTTKSEQWQKYWEKYKREFSKLFNNNMGTLCVPFFEVDKVFTQLWGNTACGIDVTKDHQGVMAGAAMTEGYTVVIKEKNTNAYFVYFNGIFAYMMLPEDEQSYGERLFHRDLERNQMLPVSKCHEYEIKEY